MDTNKKSANCSVKEGTVDARVKYNKQIIARRNTEFILDHQNDSLEQLSDYLKACMDDIGHAPAKVEVIGGDYIEYRFGSWEKALGRIYSGPLSTIKYPPAFKDRKIVQDMLRQALEQYRSTHPQKGVQ